MTIQITQRPRVLNRHFSFGVVVVLLLLSQTAEAQNKRFGFMLEFGDQDRIGIDYVLASQARIRAVLALSHTAPREQGSSSLETGVSLLFPLVAKESLSTFAGGGVLFGSSAIPTNTGVRQTHTTLVCEGSYCVDYRFSKDFSCMIRSGLQYRYESIPSQSRWQTFAALDLTWWLF